MDKQPRNNQFDGPRTARSGELKSVLDTVNEVMRVAAGLKPTIATDYPMIYNEENLSNIMIIKDGDRVVSSVAVWPNTIEIGSTRLSVGGINCLVTLPEYRRQGLASQVMEAAHQLMTDRGCHVARLTTNIARWYNRLGWEAAGRFCTFEINQSNVILLRDLVENVTIRCLHNDLEEATMTDLVNLHQSDRLGGVRSPGLMRTLLQAGSDPKVTPDTWIVFADRKTEAAAYLIDRNGTVTEWGGPAELVSGLIRAWYFEREKNRIGSNRPEDSNAEYTGKMWLTTPPSGHPLPQLLEQCSFPCRCDYWGMLYILDPRGILDAFGCGDISISKRDGYFILERGNDRVAVDRSGLTKLLFGPERVSCFAEDVLPFTFWEWPIEHV